MFLIEIREEDRVLPLTTIEIIAIKRLQKRDLDWRYRHRCQRKLQGNEMDFLQ